MAKHEIKFYGSFDGSQIEQQTKRLSKTIDDSFGKEGVQIVDKKSISFLDKEAGNATRMLKDEIKRLAQEAKRYDQAIRDSAKGSQEHNKLAKSRLDITEQQVKRERELATIQRMQSRIMSTQGGFMGRMNPFGGGQHGQVIDVTPRARQLPGARQGFMSRMGGALGRGAQTVAGALPGVGGMAAGAMGGAGAMAGAGLAGVALGAVAAAAGAAAIGIARMASAAEVYSNQIPNFLKLSAQGQTRAGGVARETAQQLGFSAQETFDTQLALNRALGQTTQRGSEARVANVLTASRQLGLDPSEIAGSANQLRQVGGTQAASKQIAQILDKAVTKGMDASQASSWLAASTQLLTELNETGIMSTDRMLAAMADLSLDAGLSAEQSAHVLRSMNAAISGSQGEANAFFQMGAARGGLGGGSILESQEAVRQGLTGLNMSELTRGMSGPMADRTRSAFGNLSDQGNYTRNFAGGIMDQLDAIAPDTGSNESFLYRSRVTADMFGASTAGEGARILAVLEKLREGQGELTEGEQSLIDSLEKDPEKEWRSNVRGSLDKIAINTASLNSKQSFVKTDLGETSQNLFNSLTDALIKLDQTILSFLQSDTFQGLKDMFSGAMNGMASMGSSISEGWDEFMADPAKFGQNMAEGFVEILGTFWDKTLEKLQALVDAIPGVGSSIASGAGKVYDAGKGVFNSMLGRSTVTGADEKFMEQPWFQGERNKFKNLRGHQLDPAASEEFVTLQRQQQMGQPLDAETLKDFNKQQKSGDDISMKDMVALLERIANNTGKTANGKRRVELQGSPKESTAPGL